MVQECSVYAGKIVAVELREALVNEVLQRAGFVEPIEPDARLDVCFVSPAPVECHARVGGHPVLMAPVSWIPAFAGMTRGHKHWQCIYEMDI
jgi:hypothetical protein